MNLLFSLPSYIMEALSLTREEQIIYCSPYDISPDGAFARDAYLTVTDKRLILSDGAEIRYQAALQNIAALKCEAQVGNGVLIVREVAGEYSEDTIIARFSMKHLTRVSYIVKGALLLCEGSARKVISKEPEKTCPVCGRALPGTKECPKCKGRTVVFSRVADLCSPYKKRLLIIGLLMVLVSLLNMLLPEIQKRFVDQALLPRTGTVYDILVFAAASLTVALAIIGLNVLKMWLCSCLGTKVSMDLRARLYQKVQLLSLSYIQDRKPGDLMNRVVGDTKRIRNFMQEAFGEMFSCIVTMAGVIILMLRMNFRMTLISVLFLPIVILLTIGFRKTVKRRFHSQWVKQDKANSGLQDVISGMRVVKSFGKEEAEAIKFERLNQDFCSIQKRNEVFWAVFYPLLTFIMGTGVYFVTYLGGAQVLYGAMTRGELIQFVAYAGILYGPLGWMTHLPRMITNMLTSLERIYDILGEQPAIADDEWAEEIEIQGDVEFRQVSFGYKPYEPVLSNINLKVKKGEMIGLVGASGTGKSTLINLLMRLYEVNDGVILIDGHDINRLKAEHYHSQLGVVLQENFLFSGTILENLRFAKPDAGYEEIIRAAKMANAHDFICKTPSGYHTRVGEHGHNLSGGERQRLAIARAILNNPRLLILDEATSSLDTESEYLIQKALERLTAGRTTFAIAHRLSTLRNADRLVVIDGHNIAEVGTHNELIEKKGIYYKLVTAQLEMQSVTSQEDLNVNPVYIAAGN